MSRQMDEAADGVTERRAQWQRELPDVDTRGMAVLGRARRLTVRVRLQIDALLSEHGLDPGEADVLFTLLRSGTPYCLRPTELFRAMKVSSGGMTHRLGKLEKAGLIARKASEGDGRSMLVALTTEGRQTAEAAFRDDMALEAKLLDGLSEQDQAQLAALLQRLEAALEVDE